MKTMITRNNVPRHNGTMTCLLGQSGLWEFQVITLSHGLLLCGSERKRAGAGGSKCQVEVVEKRGGDREGVRRGAGGLEEVWKAVGKCGRGRKAWEVMVRYNIELSKLQKMLFEYQNEVLQRRWCGKQQQETPEYREGCTPCVRVGRWVIGSCDGWYSRGSAALWRIWTSLPKEVNQHTYF